MPVDLESRYKRLLREIVTISHEIRSSALEHANEQNFNTSERLRRQLETIRISADTILETFTKASLTNYSLDDRITDWLMTGELQLCLGKLKELDEMLKPVGQVQPRWALRRLFRPPEDKLTTAMVFFDKHKNLFHFFLTPDLWNREQHLSRSSEVPYAGTLQGVRNTSRDHIPRASITTLPEGDIETEYHTATEYDTEVECKNSESQTSPDTSRAKQKLEEVRRWLAPLDCLVKHDDVHKLRQEGTCKWLPNTDAYNVWRLGVNKFLWVHGKAGCGKSVLIASMVEHLKTTLRNEEVVVYFYFDFRSKRSTSPTEAIRSLLSQLLSHILSLEVHPKDLLGKMMEEKGSGALLLDDLDKLCDLVSYAATCFAYYPIVVMDALDECADVESLLRALVALNQGDVRLLVTSRSCRTITDCFRELPSLSFEDVADLVADDISLHVGRELDTHEHLRSADQEVKTEIHRELNSKAEGRFRWVQCQIDTLKRCASKEELREAMDGLPTELEAVYERILGAIDERHSEGMLARRTLAWLVVAMEPLCLAQLVDAFLMNTQQREHEMRGLGDSLLHALSSLVSHQKETDILMLSHFTVKEYLIGRTALQMFRVIPHEAHAVVSEMCLQYLSVFLRQELLRARVAPLRSFPMLSYILSFGFDHLAYIHPGSTSVLEALKSLGEGVHHHPSHWEHLWELRGEVLRWPYPSWPSSRHDFVIYILIAYASPGFFQSFLCDCFPMKPRAGINPLVYAADLRKTEHAMILLKFGADVNMSGLAIDDSHHALPLEVAINLGDDVLVGELLQRGCVVTSEILITAVCMPWCSTPVLVKLMQTDKFAECARDIEDEMLYKGVFDSARPSGGDVRRADEDYVSLAQILGRVGLDLNADEPFMTGLIERSAHAAHTSMLEYLLPKGRPTPSRFLFAASSGNTLETISVARFFLDRGVDVRRVSNRDGDTALHLAADCPWEPRSLELAKMLVDAGCNPHRRNRQNETPLIIALKRGYLSVAELFSYRTALPSDILHLALDRGCKPQAIRWLVSNGANVHSVSRFTRDTILHRTVSGSRVGGERHMDEVYSDSERLEILKCFIGAGCDPVARNADGETVLEVVVARHCLLLVEFLLSCNVALSLASDILIFAVRRHLPFQMVEFLISKGADVHCTTSHGNTLLHLAILSHHKATSGETESRCLRFIERFVEGGCDPAARNFDGVTVLETAMRYDCTSSVGYLLSESFNLPLPPDTLLFVLQRAFAPKAVQSLVSRGTDVLCTTSDGQTVLHLAIDRYDEPTCLNLIDSFITAGCNPAQCRCQGKTILADAMERGYNEVMALLLSHDTQLPQNILPIALRKCVPPSVIRSLVLKGADVDYISNGDTLLHIAVEEYAESSCLEVFRYFFEAGCNPLSCNLEGETVLEAVMRRGYTSVMKFLFSSGVPLPPDILPTVLRQGCIPQSICFLLSSGIDLDSAVFNGNTIFHLAIVESQSDWGCWKWMKCFIEAGCHPTTARNSAGQTVLEAAMESRYTSVVELLLGYDFPFPPNILLVALQKRFSPPIVRSLVLKGADVHATTSEGDTVLHLAIAKHYFEKESWELVDTFIEAGCRPASCNSAGKRVLETAVERGHASVVERLLSSRLDVPVPSGIIQTAIRRRCTPELIRLLARHGALDHVAAPGSDWDALLQLVGASYSDEACSEVIKILDDACRKTETSSQDEVPVHVAKKPRLD